MAIDAICGCAATVTVLSYQEAIESYLDLRGIDLDATLEAVRLLTGKWPHMRIDTTDDNLKLASDARKALLAVISKDDQLRGIDAAKMTDGFKVQTHDNQRLNSFDLLGSVP